jgi:hypothetical protein
MAKHNNPTPPTITRGLNGLGASKKRSEIARMIKSPPPAPLIILVFVVTSSLEEHVGQVISPNHSSLLLA